MDNAFSWHNIRALNGSQRDGFEQLCKQLAARELVPKGSRFISHGNPDGGVECRWILQDGTSWGWQAKFHTSRLEGDQWNGLDKSVKRFLESWPEMRRLFVCLPRDLATQGADKPHRKTEQRMWEDRVAKWKTLAAQHGRELEVVLWDETALLERLSRTENHGRMRYWFSAPEMTPMWFERIAENTIANLDFRYLPAARDQDGLHVDVELQTALDAVGRTPAFERRAKELIRNLRGVLPRRTSYDVPPNCRSFYGAAEGLLKVAQQKVWAGTADLSLDDVCALAEEATAFQEAAFKEARSLSAGTHETHACLHDVVRASGALGSLYDFLVSQEAQAACRQVLVITGEKGTGKSHLLAHTARSRHSSGALTLFCLGTHLDESKLPVQAMCALSGVQTSDSVFLDSLQSAAEVSDQRLLIVVDALNEGPSPGYWEHRVRGLIREVVSRPSLGLVLSVRTGFEDLVLPDSVIDEEVVLAHHGFASAGIEANEAYFRSFGLQPPLGAPLPTILTNPLMLYLVCRSAERQKRERLPSGQAGIAAVIEPMLKDANRTLARRDRLDFDPKEPLVYRALEALAIQGGAMARAEARKTIAAALPSSWQQRPHSQQMLPALIEEGLLAEERDWTGQGTTIRFQFELFEDWAVASWLLEDCTKTNLVEVFSPEGRANVYLEERTASWSRGVLEILSVLLPERHGRELLDVMSFLVNVEGVKVAIPEATIATLPLRSVSSIGESITTWVRRLLQRPEAKRLEHAFCMTMDAVVACAGIDEHPLNARFLHEVLADLDMPRRDALWSSYLSYWAGRDVEHRIYRARDFVASRSSSCTTEGAILLGTMLVWTLCSSHRPLRDTATKALVKLYSGHPEQLESALELFVEVDDPYLLERLLCVAFGCATRLREREQASVLLKAVTFANQVSRRFPHLLIRDYRASLLSFALHKGIDVDDSATDQFPWPDPLPTLDELERRFGHDPEERSAVFSGVANDYSDFSTYVVGTNHWKRPWSGERLTADGFSSLADEIRHFEEALPEDLVDDWVSWKAELADDDGTTTGGYTMGFASNDTDLDVDEQLEQELVEEFLRSKPEYEGRLPNGMDSEDQEATAALLDWVVSRVEQESVEREERIQASLTAAQVQRMNAVWRPFLKGNMPFPSIDVKLVKRCMLLQVLKLGWNEQILGALDRAHYHERGARSAAKPERLGKKYQWIAWHTVLALLADNFVFMGTHNGFDALSSPLAVSWSSFIRDIDPTCLSEPKGHREHADVPWHRPITYKCVMGVDDRQWLAGDHEWPCFEEMLAVQDNKGERWFPLELSETFKEPNFNKDDFEGTFLARRLTTVFQAYLVRGVDADGFYEWATRQNFWGRWMPYAHSETSRLRLREYWWHDAYKDLGRGAVSFRPADDACPFDIHLPCEEYLSEASNHDCSVQESFSIGLPSAFLAQQLKLKHGAEDGHYSSVDHTILLQDPAAIGPGRSTLMLSEDGLSRIRDAGYDVVWTLFGEKFVRGEPTTDGRTAFSGAWRWKNGRMEGTHHTHGWVNGDPKRRPEPPELPENLPLH